MDRLQEVERWLASRKHAGATVTEFMQALPHDEAERVRLALQNMERLKFKEAGARQLASNLQTAGVVAVAVQLLIAELFFIGWMPRAWFLLSEILALGLTVLLVWYLHRMARREQWAASGHRAGIKKSEFERLGVYLNEPTGTVHSLALAKKQQERVADDLKLIKQMLAELKSGAELARKAGINMQYLDREYERGNPLLTGRILLDDLLDEDEVSRIFSEMARAGLMAHTLEAILLRYESLSRSLIPSSAVELAVSRVKAGHRLSGH